MGHLKPTPISQKEVDDILAQMQDGVDKPKPKVLFEVGENKRLRKVPLPIFMVALKR